MTRDRFQALAEAHGGDIGRWPAVEREAARAFAAAQPEVASAALAPARRLDDTLAAFAIEARPALRDRILAAAPRARVIARAWRRATAVALGVGLAASAAAGVAAGFVLTPTSAVRAIGARPTGGLGDVSALADPTGDAADG